VCAIHGIFKCPVCDFTYILHSAASFIPVLTGLRNKTVCGGGLHGAVRAQVNSLCISVTLVIMQLITSGVAVIMAGPAVSIVLMEFVNEVRADDYTQVVIPGTRECS
jgi:hypothetical protein